MKVGNKNQAVGLAVVAVAAIGFLAFQLKGTFGGAAKKLQNLVAAKEPAGQDGSQVPGLPKTIYGDPFSHPALPRLEAPEPSGEEPAPALETGTTERPNSMSGALDFSPIGKELQSSLSLTAEDTGQLAVPPPKGPLIALQAVVSANSPVAFISIDGGEPQKYSVGESLTKDVLITGIHGSSVDLLVAKSRKTLNVGASIQL